MAWYVGSVCQQKGLAPIRYLFGDISSYIGKDALQRSAENFCMKIWIEICFIDLVFYLLNFAKLHKP